MVNTNTTLLIAASAAFCAAVYVAIKHFGCLYESTRKSLEQKRLIAKRLGRPPIDTNPYEDLLIDDAINPDDIDVVFESIGGLENLKQKLNDLVILPLKSPDFVSHGKLVGPLKGVLLYGLPGTGKTMLAQAIAKESGAVFINVKISKLMSKVLGDSQKLVTALFTLARKLQPAIIFIDEVDDFLGKHRSSDNEVMIKLKNEFMSLWSWNGFTTDQNSRVMILATTNRPLFELDEVVVHSFSHSFEIEIPDRRERAEILIVTLKGERVDDNIDYDYLAGLCEGCSGSDLVDLCNKAAYHSLTKHLEAENENPNQARRPLAQADLEKAFLECKKTTTAAHEYSRLASQ